MSELSDVQRTGSTSATVKRAAIVAVLSFVLGGLTAYAQGFLPDAAAPIANSASGWTVLTALLVYWSRSPVGTAAALGAVSFVLLVLGYTAASEFRGAYYNPLMFSVIGILAGPFVGAAASWLRANDLRAALGTAVLAGIGIGEAVYGLTTVRDTTDPTYWTIIGLVGAALLLGMLIRRIRGAQSVAIAVTGTIIIAAAFLFAYRSIGNIALS
ncbi:DUF6518 family protein [Pseudonocardia hispaniensis]|uniref:DUF6518 family protein n=1 Tax=Pseudonocardia hispaniensis TaxID=904933 RepID=A0ABW1J964_9PSEU